MIDTVRTVLVLFICFTTCSHQIQTTELKYDCCVWTWAFFNTLSVVFRHCRRKKQKENNEYVFVAFDIVSDLSESFECARDIVDVEHRNALDVAVRRKHATFRHLFSRWKFGHIVELIMMFHFVICVLFVFVSFPYVRFRREARIENRRRRQRRSFQLANHKRFAIAARFLHFVLLLFIFFLCSSPFRLWVRRWQENKHDDLR